jgi:hypothetical protein
MNILVTGGRRHKISTQEMERFQRDLRQLESNSYDGITIMTEGRATGVDPAMRRLTDRIGYAISEISSHTRLAAQVSRVFVFPGANEELLRVVAAYALPVVVIKNANQLRAEAEGAASPVMPGVSVDAVRAVQSLDTNWPDIDPDGFNDDEYPDNEHEADPQ